MRSGTLTLSLFMAAFSAGSVFAETIVLKTGEELEATEITPSRKALRVRLEFNRGTGSYSRTEVKRKDLTPEQEARYYGAPDGNYYSFTTTRVTDKLEYTYYYNGKNTGWRLADAGGKTLRYTGSTPNGVYREYYPGDTVKTEQSISANLRNGSSRTFFPDGTLQSETWFVDDVRSGIYRLFDSTGSLVSEDRYIRGKLAAGKPVREEKSPVAAEKAQLARKKS